MVRTRFAPSPTGRLHLGNIRIAVFNWLFARHHGGDFVLRIEDTDVERNVEGAEELLQEDLRWLGLDWDEGPDVGGPHAPYRQSERLARYLELAEGLVESGLAYPCFCTEEELAAGKESVGPGEGGERSVHRYSGHCRRLTADERRRKEAGGAPSVIRFALPEGSEVIEIEDEARGSISFPSSDFDDFVIIRSDGRPTYNFAVVCDDVDMGISHVIRGAGHLSNTPKQAVLFDALERPRPVFAHLPTVLSPGGGKLSKREGGAGVAELREQGFPPDAVVNYVSLLGWSHPDEEEVLSREELVRAMDLRRVGSSDTTWDPEKLAWLSGKHIAAMDPDEAYRAALPWIDRTRVPLDDRGLRIAVEGFRPRIDTFSQLQSEMKHHLFPGRQVLRSAGVEVGGDARAQTVLEAVSVAVETVAPWTPEVLGDAVRAAGKEVGARGRALFHPLRKVLTGQENGPDLGMIMAALGRDEVLWRIEEASRV